MTKEKAIMELIEKSQEIEALESCIKILEGWSELKELAKPLKKKQGEIESEKEALYDAAVGGKFDIGKAF
jgi:hypothetical protein|nr:MAG: hypothetical protein [Bacteriophage sp.]